MNMDDMIMISVDDHICEPPTLFDNHLSGEALAAAPMFRTAKNGKNFWAYPGRFIPCGILPTWDMDATVAELHRIAAKGCHAVSINENPTVQDLPSIHNEYWNPLWKAVNDTDMTICLHIGSGNPAPHASM